MLWIPLPNQIVSLDGTTSVVITVFFIVLERRTCRWPGWIGHRRSRDRRFAFFAYSYLLTVTEGLTRATTSSLITVAIAGACLGFLPHNFFPARMFMGDSGAMLLGLLLATSTISLTGQIDISQLQDGREVWSRRSFLVLPLALAPLFLDLTLAFIRRTCCRQVVVPTRQTTPAPSASGTRPQPASCRHADAVWSAPRLLRRDHLGPGSDRAPGTVVAVGAACALVLMVATLGRPVRAKHQIRRGESLRSLASERGRQTHVSAFTHAALRPCPRDATGPNPITTQLRQWHKRIAAHDRRQPPRAASTPADGPSVHVIRLASC